LLNTIQDWRNDLQIKAVENKQTAKANEQKYVWYSSAKNKDIKRKFSEDLCIFPFLVFSLEGFVIPYKKQESSMKHASNTTPSIKRDALKRIPYVKR
jgi:hypothetical protein